MKNKVIDLSCLVGSGVICEFWYKSKLPDQEQPLIGYLTEIINRDGSQSYRMKGCGLWDGCRPIHNHWIANVDGELVLPDGLVGEHIADINRSDEIEQFEVQLSALSTRKRFPCSWPFVRITGKAEGYIWPWEVE